MPLKSYTSLSHRFANTSKDIATILRCYGIEHSVQMRQSQWLKGYFHRYDNIVIKKKEYLEKFSHRLRAMCHIQKLTSQHVESLLKMHKHSPVERGLMCQLLVDVERSLSNLNSTLESLHNQDDPDFASNQQQLAALLYKTGDHNGALALLHRIPFTQIDENSLRRMIQLGADLNSRMSENLYRYPSGIGDALMILDFFQDLGPLVLPYSTLATNSNSAEAKEAFIKKSFLWPWIRRRVRLDLERNDPVGKSVDWKPTYLSSQLTDPFGHTYLHAAFLSQDVDHLTAIVDTVGQEGLEKDIAAQSPSYASGLTPLACSATSLGNFNAFQRILEFSDGNICRGSGSGILSHAFCALSIAARCQNHPIVEALILRSAQMNVDISECCRWTTSYLYFPQIPADIWGLLVQAQK